MTNGTPKSHWLELKIPPVLVAVICGLLIKLAGRYVPSPAVTFPGDRILMIAAGALGVLLILSGALSFTRSGTTTDPIRPGRASSLVTTGLYRFTRNPMYLGFLLGLTAYALKAGSLLSLVALPLFMGYMTRFQIIPEERALADLFGESFDSYLTQVRRWI